MGAMDKHESVKGQEDALPSLHYATTICATKMGSKSSRKVHHESTTEKNKNRGVQRVEMARLSSNATIEEVKKDYEIREKEDEEIHKEEHHKQNAHLKARLQARQR